MMEPAVFREALAVVFDSQVGIVGAFGEAPPAAGPRFLHYRARLCDTARLGGVAIDRNVAAAGTEDDPVAVAALASALARYAAALYDRGGLPTATAAGAPFPCVSPGDFALFDDGQYAEPGFPYVCFTDDTPVKWTSVVDLATGETAFAPAAFVWSPFPYFRGAGDMPVIGSDPGGFACAATVAAAALAGLYDVIARDAAALFWQAMTQPAWIAHDTLPPRHAALVARFKAAGITVTLLNVATDNRIPAFVATASSEESEHPAYVFAVAAGLDPAAALEAVLLRLAADWRYASETARLRPAPGPGQWEDVITTADHVSFAADHANRDRIAAYLGPGETMHLADCEDLATGSVDGDLETAIGRIMTSGHRVYAANLTGEDVAGVGLHVCRALVPGYQPLLAGHRQRALGGDRLYEAPRKLGHRGIARGSGGNPDPHPFR